MLGEYLLDHVDAKALIAHERPDERAFAAEIVRNVGIRRVRQAQNGTDALWLLKHEHFDVAVIDWNLGGMTAQDFVHGVRRMPNEQRRAMPIVILTTRAKKPDIAAALAAGVDSYIIKPVASIVLARRLEAALTRPREFIVSPTYIGPCRRRTDVADFAGPWRRLADKPMLIELEVMRAEPATELRWRARRHLDSLAVRLTFIEDRHPGALDKFASEVQSVRRLARELGDATLDHGAAVLVTYVTGRTKHFDEARAHLDALRHLTGQVALDEAQHKAVAAELVRMAEKTAAKRKAAPLKA